MMSPELVIKQRFKIRKHPIIPKSDDATDSAQLDLERAGKADGGSGA